MFSITNADAPTFYLRSLNNTDFFLSHELEKEKPILFNFFATYCGPCRRELPLLDSLMNINPEINTYYINVGSKKRPEKPEHISVFSDLLNLSHPILLDRYGTVLNKYSETQILPLTVLIDSKGEIIYYYEGYDENTIIEVANIIKKITKDKKINDNE